MVSQKFLSKVFITVYSFVLLIPTQLFAAGLPWEKPIDRIVDSLTGPVVRGAAMVAVVTTGVVLAFGEGGGFFRRAVSVVFGLSIATTAASLVATFFG